MTALAAGYSPNWANQAVELEGKSLVPSNLSFFFSMGKVLVKLMNHQFSCCRFADDNVTAMLVDEKQKRFPPLVS